MKILQILTLAEAINTITQMLRVFIDHSKFLDEDFITCISLGLSSIPKIPESKLVSSLNRLVTKHAFSRIGGGVKGIDSYLSELRKNLANSKFKTDINTLRHVVDTVTNGNLSSQLLNSENTWPINSYTKADIATWSTQIQQLFRKNPDLASSPQSVLECLAVSKRAYFLFSNGHHLNFTQITALYLGLTKPRGEGVLFQISTGSGKSIIAAIFALVISLRAKSVDIFTSGYPLAIRDANKFTKFYSLFRAAIIPTPELIRKARNNATPRRSCTENRPNSRSTFCVIFSATCPPWGIDGKNSS